MTKVFFDISMSLDGYMTASGQTPDEPMGPGGDQLVAWAFGEDERDRRVLPEGVAGTGAVIAGRRTYDTSLPWWGADSAPAWSTSSRSTSPRSCGGGTRMFEQLGDEHIGREPVGLTGTVAATHCGCVWSSDR